MFLRASRKRAAAFFASTWLALSAALQPALADPYGYDPKFARSGERATVLLRVESIFNDQPRKIYGTLFSPMPYVADMGRGEAPVQVRLLPFGKIPGADDGWIAMSLPPGSYFLLLQPTGWMLEPPSSGYSPALGTFQRVVREGDTQGTASLTTFWFTVPEQATLVYVGTVVMKCRGEASTFSAKVAHCDDYIVVQEPDRAAAQASLLLPGRAPPVSGALRPYGTARPGANEAAPVVLRIEANKGLAGAAYTPAPDMPGTVVVSNDPLTMIVGNLVAAIAEHAIEARDASKVRQAEAAAAPCVDAVSRQLRDFDLDGALRSALTAQLGARLLDQADDGAADRLTVSLERLRLRECRERATLCVDIGVRLRLIEATTGAPRLEERLTYSAPYAPGDPFKAGARLYERLVRPASRCTALADWCGPYGPQLLVEEIRRGFDSIAAQLARDLSTASSIPEATP
jgi:hypothetical protein